MSQSTPKPVSTRFIAAAVHLVTVGHHVVRTEPDPVERGRLVWHFAPEAEESLRVYQSMLKRMRDHAYSELRARDWM